MKKVLLFFTLSLFLASCGGNNEDKNLITVKIGHVGESDRTIWKPVQEKLLKEGIKVELVSFADYTIPNQALNDGDIDLDAFQHHAYYSNEVNTKGYDLSILGVGLGGPVRSQEWDLVILGGLFQLQIILWFYDISTHSRKPLQSKRNQVTVICAS